MTIKEQRSVWAHDFYATHGKWPTEAHYIEWGKDPDNITQQASISPYKLEGDFVLATSEMMEHNKPSEPPILLPMSGRIVVQPLDDASTPSGILVVRVAAEQKATIGKIVALPSGHAVNHNIAEGIHEWVGSYEGPLEIGDVVLFGQNSGMQIDLGFGSARRRAIILRENEVLCKVTNAKGEPYA